LWDKTEGGKSAHLYRRFSPTLLSSCELAHSFSPRPPVPGFRAIAHVPLLCCISTNTLSFFRLRFSFSNAVFRVGSVDYASPRTMGSMVAFAPICQEISIVTICLMFWLKGCCVRLLCLSNDLPYRPISFPTRTFLVRSA